LGFVALFLIIAVASEYDGPRTSNSLDKDRLLPFLYLPELIGVQTQKDIRNNFCLLYRRYFVRFGVFLIRYQSANLDKCDGRIMRVSSHIHDVLHVAMIVMARQLYRCFSYIQLDHVRPSIVSNPQFEK